MNEKPVIGIAGFGLEGRALYEHFKDSAAIHVFDEAAPDLSGVAATFHNNLSIPPEIEVVYKTPGIPSRKLIRESEKTRVSTLMDLVLEQVHSRAVGITGTKGKSTVASLIAHILKSCGRDTVLFGNIGIADLKLLDDDSKGRTYVIELSSYQCEYLTHSPHIAVLTNFYPEHLSHHGSLERYREAKLNIARFQTGNDTFINGSDIETSFAGKMIRPDESLQFETKLMGGHNQHNCALALAAVRELGVSEETAREHIKTFEPLLYRLERLGTFNGVTFYDDSLATVPQATEASLRTLPHVDTLILGGEDRGISFDAFADFLATTNVETFIVFPDTGAKMVTKVQGRTVIPVTSMEEAVRAAYVHTPADGVVLLSNASPSFNLFKDYKDKSAQYRKWIQTLEKATFVQ